MADTLGLVLETVIHASSGVVAYEQRRALVWGPGGIAIDAKRDAFGGCLTTVEQPHRVPRPLNRSPERRRSSVVYMMFYFIARLAKPTAIR